MVWADSNRYLDTGLINEVITAILSIKLKVKEKFSLSKIEVFKFLENV